VLVTFVSCKNVSSHLFIMLALLSHMALVCINHRICGINLD
jgi:hypothetical protein